mgnify:CR=1 FL=1
MLRFLDGQASYHYFYCYFFQILSFLGMQDFNYVHSNCFEITIELTCCKYPDRSTLVTEWENNKESMLKYMEAVHLGVKGIVTDQINGEPIENAAIKVTGNAKIVYTTKRGEYWRLLKPGKLHEITVSAKGYLTSQPILVNIDETLSQRWFSVTRFDYNGA